MIHSKTSIAFILLILCLAGCDSPERTLPIVISPAKTQADRVIPLVEGNIWEYANVNIETGEADPASVIRTLNNVGPALWKEKSDTNYYDLGSYNTFEIVDNDSATGYAYCQAEDIENKMILYGLWDESVQSYVVLYEISDFPEIGFETYEFKMEDIRTITVPAGKAYDCYVFEGMNSRQYYLRGVGLVKSEETDDERNPISSFELISKQLK